MKIICTENTQTFGNFSPKNLKDEAGLAGLTNTLNFDVTDGGSLGNVVVYTIKQEFFLMLICCVLRYLCLYSKAGVGNLLNAVCLFTNNIKM